MAKKDKVAAAFHEVYTKVPKSVKKTGKTGEAKRKMMTAIALSKARAAGASVPAPDEDHNPGNPGRQRPFAVSQSYDVYNGHAGDAESGVCHTQPDGLSRALPKAEAVTEAKAEAGVAKKCADQQVGENRAYLNKHDQEHNTGKAHE